MSGVASMRGVPTGIRAYRILKRKFVTTAFSGEGARLYGGRWNSVGVAAVYTSGVISLAILEWRAHLTQWPAPPQVLIEIEFEASLVWSPPKLPSQWRRCPSSKANAAVSDNWVRSGRSAVLRVPSPTVPSGHVEYNYLLNPAHPDFRKIKIGKPSVFKADPGLGRWPVLSRLSTESCD
jgi:RES domain-containing protein